MFLRTLLALFLPLPAHVPTAAETDVAVTPLAIGGPRQRLAASAH